VKLGPGLAAVLAMGVAVAMPSSALTGVPKTACEVSPTEIIVSSQAFLGANQFPNVLTFSERGKLVFTHGTSERQSDLADIEVVRYDPVPLVLNLFSLSIAYRGDGVTRSKSAAYVAVDCLSQLIRRFDSRLTFKHGRW